MAGPEWPPSPWRLLRALASSWFCARPRLWSDQARDRLLEALGRAGAPAIWLPSSALHEIQYYQPARLGASDRVLHDDHFAVPEGGRFWFRFETRLEPDQRALLAELLGRLQYLGRSESRARLRLEESDSAPPGVFWVMPRGGIQSPSPVALGELVVRVPGGRLSRLELDALLGVGRIRASRTARTLEQDGVAAGGAGYPITVVPEADAAAAGPAAAARRWRSVTPFLPPLRHRRGRDETCVEQQVIACVERLCGSRPRSIHAVPGPGGLGSVSSLLAHDYGVHSERRWTLTRRLGFWLELTFDQPVILNPAFGADAHFGAGQFAPCHEAEAQ